MKVVVTGATGNVGTSVLAALQDEPEVTEVVGLARRRPPKTPPKTRWVERDIVTDAILRLDPEGKAAVDWSEKKNKAK